MFKKNTANLLEQLRSSKNFDANHIWLTKENGEIISPYKSLPPLFENMSEDEIDDNLSELENIR